MAAAFCYPMEQVFLARHGETEWNRIRRRQGQLNSPLTRGALAQPRGRAPRTRTGHQMLSGRDEIEARISAFIGSWLDSVPKDWRETFAIKRSG